ncbi:hypothetical protein JXO59_15595, partial [candidate division KSB1 bacterium]|nr:hypothetical protein [candidate division KSB1 bacterium]
DGSAILRRRGGGGAVVLMPGIACITCAFKSVKSNSPYHFFRLINEWIMNVLQRKYHIHGLSLRGTSDITLNDKKILGCSMFKSRQTFLYQGSLMIRCDFALINRYLKHPSREPDYRRGRSHDEFMTTLWREGYRVDLDDIIVTLYKGAPQLRRLLL